MSSLMHRFLRVAAFAVGLAVGVGGTVFGYSNTAHLTLRWWVFQWHDIPLGGALVLALVIGIISGYVYHLPARMHHFNEHMRHRHLVHELEKENQDLRKTMDHLLEMPETSLAALPAKHLSAKKALEAPDRSSRDAEEIAGLDAMLAEPVIVHEVRPAARPAANGRAAKRTAAVKAAAPAGHANGHPAPARTRKQRTGRTAPDP